MIQEKSKSPKTLRKPKKLERPKYNLWQNTAYMIGNAWRVRRSVLYLCVLLAVVAASKTVAELLIAPVILHQVEAEASLSEIAAVVGLFGVILFVLSGLKGYLNENTLYGRIEVRTDLMGQVGLKIARTSYPNLLDTRFISMESKAMNCCIGNRSSSEAIWGTWTQILTNLIGFLAYLALLSGLNPLLMTLVTVTAAGNYLVEKRILEWGYRHREEESAYCDRLHYIRRISVARQPAKDIRIFGLKDWLEDIWSSTLELYRSFLIRREKRYFLTDLADLCLTLMRNGIAYTYLIHLVLQEGLPASEFLLYFTAVGGFTQWVTGILDQFSVLHTQSLELSVLREFLEWPEPFLFEEGEPLAKEPDRGYEIRLEDVSYRYPEAEQDTICRINLTIHPGEKLAIVGLNGAGKTTLVKLISGLLDPTEGRVLLDGQDIRRYNRRDYYALFSAVFQDFSVLESTVAVNVSQNLRKTDRERVMECLDQAGLSDKIRSLPQGADTVIGRQVFEGGVELSGGQTQRLMLARALYKNAPILLLDEPTAALDPIAENDIYRKYNEMTAGRTSLFISHRLASTRFCDRILFLEQGQVKEEGTHEELLALGGSYAGLFETQSRYYQEGGEDRGEEKGQAL